MAAKPPKTLRGVDPNLQNTRQSHKAAEEARAVYDKTVAKLRELSPKHSRKLDATSGKNASQPNDNLDDLPIFAAPKQDAAVVLICRSGKRSQEAGEALLAAGFERVLHIEEGFEGERDEHHHRGTLGGWRFHGLPWEQC